VDSFAGNVKSYLLALENISLKVPVARSSIAQFKKALGNTSK
jgi:DNA-binding LytR/AlgR family response regulator